MTPSRHRTLAAIRACDPHPPHEAAYPEYFVVMVEMGHRGCEAIVDPEITRREVISRILSFEYDPAAIRFIHHITSTGVEDVTFAIMAECAREALENLPSIDRQAAEFDHAQDHRKNWEG